MFLLAYHRTQSGDEHHREAERLTKSLVDHWLAEAAAMHKDYRYLAEISAMREVLRLDPTPAHRANSTKSPSSKWNWKPIIMSLCINAI